MMSDMVPIQTKILGSIENPVPVIGLVFPI